MGELEDSEDFEILVEDEQKNEGERAAIVYLNDALDDETKNNFLQTLDQLFFEYSPIDRIKIIIDSLGGSVKNAWAIYDRLQRIKLQGVKLEAVVEGVAASSATIVLLACDERKITLNSRIAIHLPAIPPLDCVIDEKRAAEILAMLRVLKIKIATLMADKTGQQLKITLRDMEQERDFSAQEALAYGFVHEII